MYFYDFIIVELDIPGLKVSVRKPQVVQIIKEIQQVIDNLPELSFSHLNVIQERLFKIFKDYEQLEVVIAKHLVFPDFKL